MSDFHLRKPRKYIQLGQVKCRESIDKRRIPHLGDIQPTNPPSTSGRSTPLGTHHTQMLTNSFITVQLGRERSLPHTRAVRLGGTINPTNLAWTHTQPSQHTPNRWIRTSHIRICSKINIQHGSIGTLNQNPLSRIIRIIRILNRIRRHGRDPLGNTLIVRQLPININLQSRIRIHRGIRQLPESHLKEIKILQISNTDPITRYFGSVGRTNPLFGRSNLVPSQLVLLKSVNFLMKVKYNVRTVRE
mmetsp:Transcript_17969/g.29440  ORF Transcript_17969/g.29440 Transcript_17969/m.29440 type:complete len:246 (+) Transcript_17969:461-1198(+)